ncbi:uncharacterized protein [Ptychodera flava]|uniref:uncharacterized protein n=1 Tax=Ptychodera flava TaxID=63121 RepID=UPI003969CF4E
MDSTTIAQLSFDDRDPRNAASNGLTPGEMYQIITHIPGSAHLTKVAYQITNPLALSAVNIDSVTPDCLELSWNAEGNYRYMSFEVTYDPADGSTASPSSVMEPHTLLEGLSSQTEYTVSFVVVISGSAEADAMRSDPFPETIQTAKPPTGVINVGTGATTRMTLNGDQGMILPHCCTA